MNINVIVVGDLDTNCYILEKDNNILIIDPGAESNKIISCIDPNKKVVGVITTHAHFDHVGALSEIVSYYNCKHYSMKNMNEGHFSIKNFDFFVIYTPGHLDDCISIYFDKDKIMFVGDFIFYGSVGRTDLPGANPLDMKKSITKILKYDSDITLYPGHYQSTILGNEIDNLNYFMNII